MSDREIHERWMRVNNILHGIADRFCEALDIESIGYLWREPYVLFVRTESDFVTIPIDELVDKNGGEIFSHVMAEWEIVWARDAGNRG